MVEESPLESLEGNGGLCISVLIFCLWKKEDGEKWRESKRDNSPLESGFWGTQAQESVNLASLRGVAGRGVLGGLIRRMLSHHPSRQAGENWLAPCRVEFTGRGGGGGCGAVHWIPVTGLWSVSGSQQQINKISFLLPFTCRGSSPSQRYFSQLALALWPLRLLWEMRSPGSRRVGQSVREK